MGDSIRLLYSEGNELIIRNTYSKAKGRERVKEEIISDLQYIEKYYSHYNVKLPKDEIASNVVNEFIRE